jgi:hypothetical protein
VETIELAPHDPLPDDKSHILVMRRFAEEDPARTEIEVSRSAGGFSREGVNVKATTLEQAVVEARQIASREGLKRLYVIDRTAGKREQDILKHHGDHTVHMEELSDTDPEDGEQGPDMRSGH